MKLIDEEILEITPKSEQNGAGPKGYGWLVPDQLGLVNIEKACNIHDAHYYWIADFFNAGYEVRSALKECLKYQLYLVDFAWELEKGWDGDNKDFAIKYVNNKFYKNLQIINKEMSPTWLGRQIRKPVIYAYYLAVVKFGKHFLD